MPHGDAAGRVGQERGERRDICLQRPPAVGSIGVRYTRLLPVSSLTSHTITARIKSTKPTQSSQLTADQTPPVMSRMMAITATTINRMFMLATLTSIRPPHIALDTEHADVPWLRLDLDTDVKDYGRFAASRRHAER